MYQPLLTRRYLASKVMPLLAALAVTLCTAMVLIVWSVMGGFLNMLLASGKSMIGDVSIAFPAHAGGLAHYGALIDELEARPEVEVATPLLETFAMLSLPDGDKRQVIAMGVDPDGYHAVTGWFDRLYWGPLAGAERDAARLGYEAELERLRSGEPGPRIPYDRRIELSDADAAQLVEDGRRLAEADRRSPDAGPRPAIVLGLAVTGYNRRTKYGYVEPLGVSSRARGGGLFLPHGTVRLTVPSFAGGAVLDADARSFPVANEFSSAYHVADSQWVLVPLDVLQEMLKLDEATRVATEPRIVTGEDGVERLVEATAIDVEPARVSHVLIKAAAGFTPKQVQAAAARVYESVHDRHPGDMQPPGAVLVYTWEEKPGLELFIAAVKRETVMVVSLFGVISSVASFLIFAIFWSMISEKTKDIGVLRALGASRAGVAWLFLRYGIAIGVLGAGLGLLLAWVFITNINAIHAFLAEVMGVEIWSPETYLFTEIPSDLEWRKVAFVLAGAVGFSVIGALAPAVRAARMDPVKSLRFE